MSNEALEHELEQEVAAPPEQEEITKESVKFTEDDWRAAQEEKARSRGWKPLADFIEEGGDPGEWRDASAFNTYGEMVKSIKNKEKEFEERLNNVQKLTQAQIKLERDRLIAERDALIEEGGRAKDVKVIDNAIAQLVSPVAPPTSPPAVLEEWNDRNPWINERSPKATFAKSVFAEALQNNKSIPDAIKEVDAELAKHYPSTPAPKPRPIPESERGRSSGFKSRTTAPTMDSLTAEESKIWSLTGDSMWGGDKAAFLKAVADDRKSRGEK